MMSLDILEHLCEAGHNFYDRGYAFGSTGNLSVRVGDEIWITPTGKPLKGLTPALLARMDLQGSALSDNHPSKEFPFHLAIYRNRESARAVVHLHSTYSVALSCLEEIDPEKPLPAITPYYFMRVAPLAVLPYFRPGSGNLGEAVGNAAADHHCLLLRNHGLIAAGGNLNEAIDCAEELEETCRLFFVLRGDRLRELTAGQIEELRRAFNQC